MAISLACCLLPAAATCAKCAQTYRMHAEINYQTILYSLAYLFVGCYHDMFSAYWLRSFASPTVAAATATPLQPQFLCICTHCKVINMLFQAASCYMVCVLLWCAHRLVLPVCACCRVTLRQEGRISNVQTQTLEHNKKQPISFQNNILYILMSVLVFKRHLIVFGGAMIVWFLQCTVSSGRYRPLGRLRVNLLQCNKNLLHLGVVCHPDFPHCNLVSWIFV